MPAIDMHAHAFPDDLAVRAIPKLEAAADWKAVGPGTVDGLLASMDAADVDISVICMIATKPAQTPDILKWCKKVASERLLPLPSVHPDDPKACKWVDKIAKAGFLGIKLHPMYQNFQLDDARADPVYEALVEHDLILTAHCGRDIAFPEEDDRASVDRICRMLDRHPKLRLLATHLGGWQSWDDVASKLAGRNVFMETSFSLSFLAPDRAAEIIRTHGVDRVCLGTDWPWNAHAEEIARVQALPLEQADIRKILYSNAAGLLGF